MANRRWSQRRGRRRTRQSGPNVMVRFTRLFAAFLGIFVAMSILTVFLGGGVAFAGYSYITQDLAPPETIATREVARTAKIYDRRGRILYEIFDPQFGRRTTVPLNDISPYLLQATIATEDADFYENQGINIRGIMRAAWDYVSNREVVSGGSSITQQLVKNVFIPEEERAEISLVRKIKEAALSIELTRRFTKDQILEFYLNEINYGNLSYGIEAAAQSYFSKSARDLNLAESAMLAGLPQAPSRHSPLLNLEAAKQRQHAVLDLMVRQEFITQHEANAAKNLRLEYKAAKFDIKAPHFVVYVRELLLEKYGARTIYQSGLEVTTTLDLDLQEMGEQIVSDQVAKAEEINAHNAALVAIVPETGEILAMVGSADYFDSSIDGQVNLATAERQPGSSFKPFTYITAFMEGWNPATMLLDVPITIDDGINPLYTPENFDESEHGAVSLRQAFSNSMNIPAIRTIQFTGIHEVIRTAHKMGITGLNRAGWYGLSLTLGGGEVKLLDHTYAYSVFANQGLMAGVPVPPDQRRLGHRSIDPVAILKVTDVYGNILEEFKKPQTKQVVPPEYTYLVTDILSDNEARAPVFGNSLTLEGERPAAVKTGTTEDLRDFWTMGYTPELAVGVWMGNSDNTELTGGFSGTTTGPIWLNFMNRALEGTPISEFQRPPNIVTATVCVPSGLLPTEHCQKEREEIFVKGHVPTEKDNLYQLFKIDRINGLLAGDTTPSEDIEERVFLLLPPEADEWMDEHDIERPPTAVSAGAGPTGTPITLPTPGSYVRDVLVVQGSVSEYGLERFFLEIGEGASPTKWTLISLPQTTAVDKGQLAAHDVRDLNGQYTIRMLVFRNGRETHFFVPITIDNTAPTIRLTSPVANTTFTLNPLFINSTQWIQAEASDDDSGIARVDFYINGNNVGSSTSAPYYHQWRQTPGVHSMFAVAFDKAGHSAQTPVITVAVKGGLGVG